MARQFTVAVIDNDDSIRKALQRLLLSSGYAVQAYSSAEAFLECDAAERADCLLLDVRLGGASGIQLQRNLLEMNRQVPTVFMTSHQDENSRRAALEAGASGFLSKPADTDALLESIRRALERLD
ncbi:response regulator [Roseiconus nitratireducens]|uniref:Response regulator n=1 Tax=Roseiconus nitratireducens TaxID=2605748 RepID=A0A5M6D5C9_9BACT|nr:response regulator [Roseiconus nitratireducens]KAA5542714.1 response regulator [Roseiconus nitratireducens]